ARPTSPSSGRTTSSFPTASPAHSADVPRAASRCDATYLASPEVSRAGGLAAKGIFVLTIPGVPTVTSSPSSDAPVLVAPLTTLDRTHVAVAGGKGANLGELTRIAGV